MFADRAWLYAGKQLLQQAVPLEGDGNAGPYSTADALLRSCPSGRWQRPSLDLLLSDEMSRSVTLPWQDGLRTTAQQLCYAEACLEDAGVQGARWTVQFGYRRYGRAGIAFAVQTDTLTQLVALAEVHRLRLRSVLPVAVAAYWRHALAGAADSLVLLEETRRVSALYFSGGGMAALEVQPVTDSHEVALRRLLRRLQLQTEHVAAISCWSAGEPQQVEAAAREYYPDARLRLLPKGSLG
jgi:hypothetical protein